MLAVIGSNNRRRAGDDGRIAKLGDVRDHKTSSILKKETRRLFANKKPKSEARFPNVFTLLIYDKYFRLECS